MWHGCGFACVLSMCCVLLMFAAIAPSAYAQTSVPEMSDSSDAEPGSVAGLMLEVYEKNLHAVRLADFLGANATLYEFSPDLSFARIDNSVLYLEPDFDDSGIYEINTTATWTATNTTTSIPLTITVYNVNRPPVVCDPYDLALTLGAAGVFDVSDCVYDPDAGDSIDTLEFVFGSNSDAQRILENHMFSYPNLRIMAPGMLLPHPIGGTLVATDSNGGTGTGSVVISTRDGAMLEESNDVSQISGFCGHTSLLNATVVFSVSSNILHAIQFHDDADELADSMTPSGAVPDTSGPPVTFLDGAVDIRLQRMTSSEIGALSDPTCPCNLTLSYADHPDFDEDRLAIYHFDTQEQEWEVLQTASHDTQTNMITTTIESLDGFSPFALGIIGSSGSLGDDQWRKKPTFGMSWESESVQMVRSGFTFNDYTLDITDNWHTDFERTSGTIGDVNHATIKVYAPDGLSAVSLILGIPEIGDTAGAESILDVIIQQDYLTDAGHTINDVIHDQALPLVDPDMTVAGIERSFCSDTDDEMYCYTIYLEFVINAPLSHDVIALQAIDTQRRSTVTYLNHGIEFEGDSLLAPATATIHHKNSNQGGAIVFDLVQTDRRFPIYEDQFGGSWSVDSFGTWNMPVSYHAPRLDDAAGRVMTRHNSNFEDMVGHEHDRARDIFDSDSIQGHLGTPHTIEFGWSERMSPELLERMKTSEQQALEILESSEYYDRRQ